MATLLEPASRYLYLDALKPPPGYRFDCAVTTTFSLDLIALLAAPLAFTALGWRKEVSGIDRDPLPVLDALRRHIDRIAVFCQKGQIKVPARYQPLFDFLEGTVHEVDLAERGVFHPKVWLLRYEDVQELGPVRHRFLCLSRNLTFDTHWDTVLVLDGELKDRRNAFTLNHPLGDFVAALPGLCDGEVSEETRQTVDRLQHEVRRVAFEPPPPFTELAFHPLGLTRRSTWPFPADRRRRLAMAPFVTPGFLERFASRGSGHVLITRADQLAAVEPERRAAYERLFELEELAQPEDEDPETVDTSAEEAESVRLHGLHAKLFVIDDGHQARVWTGSANATTAAFNGNVEFLVELVAGRSSAGIDKIMGEDGSAEGLRPLLRPIDSETLDPSTVAARKAEEVADKARRSLAAVDLSAVVSAAADGPDYDVVVVAEAAVHLPSGVSATVRPLSLPHAHAARIDEGAVEIASFAGVSFEHLTSFFVFQLEAKAEGESYTSAFVLNLPLVGAPEGRRDAVLSKLLARKEDFLRFLLLLLAETGMDIPLWLTSPGGGEGATGAFRSVLGSGRGLLELLLRALARDPEKLRTVAEVIADLRSDARAQDVLPEGFEAVWDAIWAVAGEEARQ